MVGSAKYVKLIGADHLAKIAAFINLECLGLGETNVWVHRSNPALVKRLAEVAASVHLPLHGVNVDRIGDDDTHSFFSKKIAVISIHSVTQETLGVLHSSRDDLAAVRQDDYYTTYKLVAFYLAYLDQVAS